MTISRNEFIAETAARFYATRSTGAPFELRGFSIQAFNAAHGEAEAFAQELERENCAPWANYDLIVSHGRQEAIDAAVTKERERCAQAVEAFLHPALDDVLQLDDAQRAGTIGHHQRRAALARHVVGGGRSGWFGWPSES